MKDKYAWMIILIIIVSIGCGIYTFINGMFSSIGELVEDRCFMSHPCKGQDVEFDLSIYHVDIFFEVRDGKIGLVNTLNEKTPIVFKLNKKNVVSWAKELDVSDCLPGEELKEMNSIRVRNKDFFSISFTDNIFGENSTIFFDENNNFEVLCISDM